MGVGERVGNASLDQIMVNLKLLGEIPDRDLSKLAAWVQLVSRATQVPIPPSYPVFGGDAFRTATGAHAAAIIKAKKKGDSWLADRIYSGVPAEMVGSRQRIEIGFMSGVSNVVHWLVERGIEPEQHLVEEIFRAAKERDRVLGDEEVEQIVKFATANGDALPLDTIGTWKTEIKRP